MFKNLDGGGTRSKNRFKNFLEGGGTRNRKNKLRTSWKVVVRVVGRTDLRTSWKVAGW